MKVLYWIALILTVVGALNWGLVGIFNYDLVYQLFMNYEMVAKVIYIVIGVAGLYLFIVSVVHCKCYCDGKCECK